MSHLHEDHFDNLVAEHIRKSLPILSTPHACEHLKERGHTFLYPMKLWDTIHIKKGNTEIVLTSMPGKHTLGSVDPAVEAVLKTVPPVMGSMVTFSKTGGSGFNLYISGDTLYYDELKVRPTLI